MPYLQGDLVRVRPAEPSDIDLLETLERDEAANRSGGGFLAMPWSKHRLKTWLDEQSKKPYEGDVYGLIIETLDDGRAVGVINTHSVDRRVGAFGYGIMISEAERRKGYASDAINALVRYFFDELHFQKCNVEVYSFNNGSRALHESLGFVHEGTRRRTKYTRGAYHDEFLFGMTCEEFAALHKFEVNP